MVAREGHSAHTARLHARKHRAAVAHVGDNDQVAAHEAGSGGAARGALLLGRVPCGGSGGSGWVGGLLGVAVTSRWQQKQQDEGTAGRTQSQSACSLTLQPSQKVAVGMLVAVCEDGGEGQGAGQAHVAAAAAAAAGGPRRRLQPLHDALLVQHTRENAIHVFLQVLRRRKAAVPIKHGCSGEQGV